MAGLLKHLLFAAACFAVFQGDRRAQVAVEAREVGRVGVPHTAERTCGKNELERLVDQDAQIAELRESLAYQTHDLRRAKAKLQSAGVESWEDKNAEDASEETTMSGVSHAHIEATASTPEPTPAASNSTSASSSPAALTTSPGPFPPSAAALTTLPGPSTPSSAALTTSPGPSPPSAAALTTHGPSTPSPAALTTTPGPFTASSAALTTRGLSTPSPAALTPSSSSSTPSPATLTTPPGPSTASPAPTLSPEKKEELGKALIEAARYDKPEVVQRLLEQGADVNYNNNFNENTALHYAAPHGYLNIVEVLLKAGANVNAISKGGYTPLHEASVTGEAEVARALLAAGAEVNIQDKFYKWTPVYWATYFGYTSVARILVAAGADLNVKDIAGRTPSELTSNVELKTLLSPS